MKDAMWENLTEYLTDNSTSSNKTSGDSSSPSMLAFRFVVEVLITTPLVIVGIVANIVSFVVFCRSKQRSTTILLLQALAVADTLVLLLSFLLRCLANIHKQTGSMQTYFNDYMKYMMVYLFPFIYFVRLTDTWLTALLTVDRFTAVCYPLHAQRVCTRARCYKNMLVVVVASFLFSLPRFFELELSGNKKGFRRTTLLQNWGYTLAYRITAFSIVMYLVPMVILVVLNTRLLWVLRKAETARADLHQYSTDMSVRARRQLSSTASERRASSNTKRSVTLIVVIVVLVCIICNTMTFVTHFLRALEQCFPQLEHVENPRRYLSHVSNLMVTVNSAANFFIYCLCSRNFRLQLRAMCHCQRWFQKRFIYTKGWYSNDRASQRRVPVTLATLDNSTSNSSLHSIRKKTAVLALLPKRRWAQRRHDGGDVILKMSKVN